MCPRDGSVRELIQEGMEESVKRRGQLEALGHLDGVLNGYKKCEQCGSWSFCLIHAESDRSLQIIMAETVDHRQDPGLPEHYYGDRFEKEVFLVLEGSISVGGELYGAGGVYEASPGLTQAPIPGPKAKVIILRIPV